MEEKNEEKSKNNLNEVKQDLLKSIIYLILAMRPKEERNLDAIIRYLSIDREFMRKFEEQMLKQTPSYKYFLRVDYLRDDEYSEITKSIILMIAFGIIEQRYKYSFEDLKNDDDDVDEYVNKLF